MGSLDDAIIDPLALEEIDALSVIYADEFIVLEPENRLHAPWLDSNSLNQLNDNLSIVASSNSIPVVHLLVETIRSFLQNELSYLTKEQSEIETNERDYLFKKCISDDIHKEISTVSVSSVKAHLQIVPERMPIAINHKIPDIFHGELYIDRKSIFQAHCARVTKLGEVSLFITTLLSDRKIATATHNILAWRISLTTGSKSSMAYDCDDDRETHAGSRLLHLLSLCEAQNVVVVVSRWYGGIHLGPDRFKHINNVSRTLLLEKGFLCSTSNRSKRKNKKS